MISVWVKEQEANAFAFELLMPEKMVMDSVEDFIDGQQSFKKGLIVKHIAEKYEVSEKAAEARLVQLHVI